MRFNFFISLFIKLLNRIIFMYSKIYKKDKKDGFINTKKTQIIYLFEKSRFAATASFLSDAI